MAKGDNMIIAGSDCEGCKYYDNNVINNMITCEARNKKYYYGQCVPCDDKEIIKE